MSEPLGRDVKSVNLKVTDFSRQSPRRCWMKITVVFVCLEKTEPLMIDFFSERLFFTFLVQLDVFKRDGN